MRLVWPHPRDKAAGGAELKESLTRRLGSLGQWSMTSCSRTWLHKVPDNSCLLTNGFHNQVNLAEGAAVLGTYFFITRFPAVWHTQSALWNHMETTYHLMSFRSHFEQGLASQTDKAKFYGICLRSLCFYVVFRAGTEPKASNTLSTSCVCTSVRRLCFWVGSP